MASYVALLIGCLLQQNEVSLKKSKIEFCKHSDDSAEDFHFRRCIKLVSDLEEYSAEVSM